MANVNRRQWLKSVGFSSSAALLGGFDNLHGSPAKLFDPFNENDDNNLVKLSFNENPHGPSRKVKEAMQNAFYRSCRYPWVYMNQLIDRIAEKEGLTREHVVLTGGSTEGLHITGLTYGVHGGEVISAHPTFQALMSYAENFGAYINRVSLTEDFQHDLDEMELRVSSGTRLIFLCNPNNPTGTVLPVDKLTDFCERVSRQTLIFSDEAYYDYIDDPDYPSMLALVKKGQNIIVSRTFSKVYGLAGLRIGYLLARPDIARRLNKSVAAGTNVLAIHAAMAALKDQEFHQFCVEENMKAKKHIYAVLDDLDLNYQRSQTNFVFFQSGREIKELVKKMRGKGIEVGRPFPPYTDWCRISTGKMDEVEKFGVALKEVLS